MFGISFSEVIFILLIALLILGPKQLATVARKVGTFIYSMQHYFQSIKADLYAKSGLHEIKQVKNDVLTAYSSIKNSIVINRTIYTDDSESADFLGLERTLYQPELDFERQPELFD